MDIIKNVVEEMILEQLIESVGMLVLDYAEREWGLESNVRFWLNFVVGGLAESLGDIDRLTSLGSYTDAMTAQEYLSTITNPEINSKLDLRDQYLAATQESQFEDIRSQINQMDEFAVAAMVYGAMATDVKTGKMFANFVQEMRLQSSIKKMQGRLEIGKLITGAPVPGSTFPGNDPDVQTAVKENRELISFYASHLVLDGLERGLSLKQIGEAIDTNPMMRGLTSMDKYPGISIDLELRMHDDAVYYLNRRGLCDASGKVVTDVDVANPDAFFAQVVGVRITDSKPLVKGIYNFISAFNIDLPNNLVKLFPELPEIVSTAIEARKLQPGTDYERITETKTIRTSDTRIADAMIDSGFIEHFWEYARKDLNLMSSLEDNLRKYKASEKAEEIEIEGNPQEILRLFRNQRGNIRKLRTALNMDLKVQPFQFKIALNEVMMDIIKKGVIKDSHDNEYSVYSQKLLDDLEKYQKDTFNIGIFRDQILGVIEVGDRFVWLEIGFDDPLNVHTGRGLEHIWVQHQPELESLGVTKFEDFISYILGTLKFKIPIDKKTLLESTLYRYELKRYPNGKTKCFSVRINNYGEIISTFFETLRIK